MKFTLRSLQFSTSVNINGAPVLLSAEPKNIVFFRFIVIGRIFRSKELSKRLDKLWEQDQIRLVQSKTGEPLLVPMNSAIGNELFDYISTERASSELKTIILSKIQPYGELKNLGGVVKKIFTTAGVRTEGGARGVRVLRHHLVTYLLSHGIECDIASSIVGHTSPESIKPYADADIEHLRECSLSVEAYPITNNLFEI